MTADSTELVSLSGHVPPLKGRWGFSGNAVSTELLSLRDKASVGVATFYRAVSLRDKVSVMIVTSCGAVAPVEHASSLYTPVQIRTGRE